MLRLIETAPADPDAPRSQTSMAYARLKADVLGGRVFPGEKLKINELALQLAVSPGAIREALSRLVPEGLVVSRDQKGFVVAPLSAEDLEDLTRLRCDVQEIALRRSLANGDHAWEAAVLGTGHRLRRTLRLLPDGGGNPDWLAHHESFHRALIGACGSPRLLALHSQLHQQSERYRVLSVHVEGDRDVEQEHQALVDAAIDRDVDELVRLATAHIQRTTSLMIGAINGASGSISQTAGRRPALSQE